MSEFRYQADMGFTRKELLKGLPNAVVPYQVVNDGSDVVEIRHGDRVVFLTTGPDSFRTIASMKIPFLPVSLEFNNFNEKQYQEFLDRFKKYLHKGGG